MSDTRPDTEAIHQPPLPAGTRMGDFELRGVLGAGGFGIVYDAYDHSLSRRVAIKEYMPAFLAGRTSNGQITLLSQSNASTFEAGLRSFVEEARLLASLDHPALVKVYQFWKSNGTAYFVMPFYAGDTLTHHRRTLRTPFDEAQLRDLLDAMLGALEVLHAQSIVHRDVAPDNILMVGGKRPILLDFGSARRTIEGQTRKLTAVIKFGYAPIEQYDDTRAGVQGPWTDLYALGGTLYFMITGRAPPPAQMRALDDDLHKLAEQGAEGYSTGFLRVIDWMLALRPAERPQQVQQLRDALLRGGEPDTVSTTHIDLDTSEPAPGEDTLLASLAADRTRSWVGPDHSHTQRTAAPAPPARRGLAWGAGVLVLVGAGAAAAWFALRGQGGDAAPRVVQAPAALASAPPAALPPSAVAAAASPAAGETSAAPAGSAVSANSAGAAASAAPVPAVAAVAAVAAASAPAVATAPAVAAGPASTAPASARAAKAPAPPVADRGAAARAAEPPARLSPDMAAALVRAQAAKAIIDSQSPSPSPGPDAPPARRNDPPPAAASTDSAEAGATPGQPSSPLMRCRREQAQVPFRVCLESLCTLPDYRFHAVCVGLQRESSAQQRAPGR